MRERNRGNLEHVRCSDSSTAEATRGRGSDTSASAVRYGYVLSAAYPGAAAQAGFCGNDAGDDLSVDAAPLGVNAAILQDTHSSGVIQPNERLYFLQDANWDTTAVVGYDSTTQTWNVVQRYVYDGYGNITILNADWSAAPTGTQPMVNSLYQGMQYDPMTRLYYGRARWYSPSLGRWISQDPAQYVDGANLYQMETSSPTARLDANGRSEEGLPWWVYIVTPINACQCYRRAEHLCGVISEVAEEVAWNPRSTPQQVAWATHVLIYGCFSEAAGLTVAILKTIPTNYVPPGVGTIVKQVITVGGKAVWCAQGR